MASKNTQNVSLTPELQRLIGETIASGHYRSASEVVRAALRLFFQAPTAAAPAPEPGKHWSQQQLTALFAQSTAGLAMVDLTGRFTWVNDRYCAIVGRSRDELLQLRMQDITHPEDLTGNLALFAEAAADDRSFEIEKRYIRPDGSLVWVNNSVSPVRGATGKPESILAVCVDITARKDAEVSLRGSEALKKAILEAAMDSIITVTHDSRIVEWNPAAERTFGYPARAALGQDLAQLIIPPELRERHYKGMAHYLATGHGPVLNQRVELEALRADGSRFPVELAISPIVIEGQPHFTAYLRDISERKETEEALRESNQRLRSTYEHAFVGITETNLGGHYLRVNEQFCAITGYTQEELLGRTFVDITHPDDRGADLEQYSRQMAGEFDAYAIEKRYIHKDGHTVWIELASTTVKDATGHPLYGVGVVRDITDRKRWEEHQRLLINELNHRVKNTLATVQSIASNTLRNAPMGQEFKGALESRLLALARVHDVLTRENWEAANLSDIISQAIAPYRSDAEARFHCHGPDVRLSPRMALALAMALQELATNAVKYGALSNATGRVDLTWQVYDTSEGPRLQFRWEEGGGPSVQAPIKRGFGSRLIERSLAHDLGGAVSLDFAPSGLICTVDAPLDTPQDGMQIAA